MKRFLIRCQIFVKEKYQTQFDGISKIKQLSILDIFAGVAGFEAFKRAVRNSPICVAQIHKLSRNLTEQEAMIPVMINSLIDEKTKSK